jgi:hypothetical protein
MGRYNLAMKIYQHLPVGHERQTMAIYELCSGLLMVTRL